MIRVIPKYVIERSEGAILSVEKIYIAVRESRNEIVEQKQSESFPKLKKKKTLFPHLGHLNEIQKKKTRGI